MRNFSLLLILITLVSCHKPSANTLRIGTISGPETELVQVAQTVAQERYGLTVKIVEFNDYNLPNEALNEGSLDANIYQHLPYLNAAIEGHGYALKPMAKTFLYPMGLYSEKYKSMKALPNHAIIALPNDPSNEARALLLLQQAHIITLNQQKLPNINNIKENPQQFKFKPLDAAQLPRVLPDVDAAIINTTFALPAGLKPSEDALLLESKDSPYANLIVVKKDNDKQDQLALFVQAFQSEPVLQKAKALFGKEALRAW